MENLNIISSINDIRQQYKGYKDGGISFIEYLANKVLNTVDEDKNEVIKFFLDEIKSNENGFAEIALLTIVEMRAIELAPDIEKIYYEIAPFKEENWRHSIIEALMKLGYVEPKTLYREYVTSFLIKQPNNAFFLLVQYCNVDPKEALPLLSDFYVKNLCDNKEMQSFLESRIGFLVNYFLQNPIDYFPELVKQTTARNSGVGTYLKKSLLDYLNSKMVEQYSEKLINDRKNNLERMEA
ncbi:MAG: hypothetical protein KBH30_12555 [Ferruginibacter sp.]|nr:hypothetical protein [Ferruginibacter sp.]